jgi:RNA polymerase sigma-70 factor (ECF subfamily)
MGKAGDDVALWRSIKKGEKAALGSLYEMHIDVLYNYAAKICKDKEVIEDAVHDVFIDIWRYRKNLSETTSVRYYLYYALRSRLLKDLRNNARMIHDGYEAFAWKDLDSLLTISSEHEIIESEHLDERTKRLAKFLANLSPRQHEAISLRFYDDFTYEEIAGIMRINEQSVRNLIQRALLQLRQYSQLLSR